MVLKIERSVEWNKHVAYNLMTLLFMHEVLPTVFFFTIVFLVEVIGTTAARVSPPSPPRCCGRRLLNSDTVVVSLTTFQAVNSVTEIITVGGSPSQTWIDFLDYILGVKSILFSHLSYFASGLEEQTETAGLARFGLSCRRDWIVWQFFSFV